MKRLGVSIIFVNDENKVLLSLRDDKPDLPYRNMWDVPGGHVEPDETPEECIVREMKEEMGLDLKDFQLFCKNEFDDRLEYTFWKKQNLEINKINLIEGQYLRWFTQQEAASTKLAYGFNKIVEEFYKSSYIFF